MMNGLERSRDWLTRSALPLWLDRGLDREAGGFVETLSVSGEPLPLPKRCMVQARQIYVFRTAIELGLCDASRARLALESSADFLLRHYRLPSGGFRHSVSREGEPLDDTSDLYGQSFVLFGLANAYAVLGREDLAEAARGLVRYLYRERHLTESGFSELSEGKVVLRSNPHMHLFEAAIAWMELDANADWHRLASEVLNLCLARFIDPETGAIGEYFDSGWSRQLVNGKFVYEPGHLCEWSWLMGRFQLLSGRELGPVRGRLFELSERTGLSPRGFLFDQMWSDFTPKLRSSRFWPQCERIKAAAQLGLGDSAQAGMEALFRYFELPVAGLWYDTMNEAGNFAPQPVKASSLYHIVGAISEFQALGSAAR